MKNLQNFSIQHSWILFIIVSESDYCLCQNWSLQFLNLYSEFDFFHLCYYPVSFIHLNITTKDYKNMLINTFLIFHVHLIFSVFEDNLRILIKTHWMHLRKCLCCFKCLTTKTYACQTNIFLWQHDRPCPMQESTYDSSRL